MWRRTKIVCTLGPAVDSFDKIRAIVNAGMNVARISCSHGDWDSRHRWIDWVREASEVEGQHVGIMLDVQGPKFRVGSMSSPLQVVVGQRVEVGDGSGQLPIPYPEVIAAMKPGRTVITGDGDVTFRVTAAGEGKVILKATSAGVVRPKKGITILGQSLNAPSLTEKDKEDIEIGCKAGVEFVALSYVKTADDVTYAKKIIAEHDATVQVVAKIETREAVKDIASIVREADAVMVARGDLGLHLPIEDVPLVQKRIIRLCHDVAKPVITATQMMESMVENPRPTRAEATDVANAVLDGTDAVMLSGETAIGAYPVETVKYMSRLAKKAEESAHFQTVFADRPLRRGQATEVIARAACEIAENLGAKAILCFSTSGFTARMVSRFRPLVPALCGSYRLRTARQVSLLWGVRPLLTSRFNDTEEMVARGFEVAIDSGILRVGDVVVITAGIPVGEPGTTNLVTVMQVYDPRTER